MKVVIVGGGWAGCAAAVSAVKFCAEVILLERTDMLLGTGLVGGIMRNNGRFTAAEELIAMGGGELFELTDKNSLHKNIDLPGNKHASIYNVATMEPIIGRFLVEKGIKLNMMTRVEDVEMTGNKIKSVIAKKNDEKNKYDADVFIDATGTAGPPGNCSKYGNGCVMCIMRCIAFGGRVSIAGKASVKETTYKKGTRTGAMSGSCKIAKESLSKNIVSQLNEKGIAVIPIPKYKIHMEKLDIKACQQYALPEFGENVILLDTGHAKLMTPFYPLEELRQIEGFENARYEDPYAGGLGNSVRYFDMAPRDNALKVNGVENLFCGGEKAGPFVGHTEAIVTGTLAGFNAVKYMKNEKLLIIPSSLAVGDIIEHVNEEMGKGIELKSTFGFAGSVYFERMKELGLYSIDPVEISKRVDEAKMRGIFAG